MISLEEAMAIVECSAAALGSIRVRGMDRRKMLVCPRGIYMWW
jgi:hypothetical protein